MPYLETSEFEIAPACKTAFSTLQPRKPYKLQGSTLRFTGDANYSGYTGCRKTAFLCRLLAQTVSRRILENGGDFDTKFCGVEIGCNRGWTSKWLWETLQMYTGKGIWGAIDTCKEFSPPHSPDNGDELLFSSQVGCALKNSGAYVFVNEHTKDALVAMHNHVFRNDYGSLQIDFAYIDGNHTHAGVRTDHEAVHHWKHPEGITVFDDFRPKNAIEGNGVFQYLSYLSSIGVGIRLVKFGPDDFMAVVQ